jgi:uncharacterized BrkB/YihY/UPF0761 family membrane protein
MSDDMDAFLKPIPKNRSYSSRFSNGLRFGEEAVTDIFPFTLKFLWFVVPSILLGHLVDQGIVVLQRRKIFTEGRGGKIGYLTLQLLVWMLLFFFFYNVTPNYAREFQGTAAGIFFIALFFTVQTNFVTNLQSVLNVADQLS